MIRLWNRRALGFILTYALLLSCSADRHRAEQLRSQKHSASARCDNHSIMALRFLSHAKEITEVLVCGVVRRVSSDYPFNSEERLVIRLTQAGDITVICNRRILKTLQVHEGDVVQIRGRYFKDQNGSDGIDWTHHNEPGASWPYPGFISVNGHFYS